MRDVMRWVGEYKRLREWGALGRTDCFIGQSSNKSIICSVYFCGLPLFVGVFLMDLLSCLDFAKMSFINSSLFFVLKAGSYECGRCTEEDIPQLLKDIFRAELKEWGLEV